MTDAQATLLPCDAGLDDEEPEEEEPRRPGGGSGSIRDGAGAGMSDRTSTSGIGGGRSCGALIVKPPSILEPPAEAVPDSPSERTGQERVYPWLTAEQNAVILAESTFVAAAVRSEPGLRGQRNSITTALLADTSQSVQYGTNVKMQRRHSILRMSASKSSSGHGLRKSASVEFVLDHVHQHRYVEQSIHESVAPMGHEGRERDMPRRLTFEEKEELYRVRPDLEIGPVPYYNEKMQELNRRNQRRIIFSMFGGMISIILLLVIFSMWEQTD